MSRVAQYRPVILRWPTTVLWAVSFIGCALSVEHVTSLQLSHAEAAALNGCAQRRDLRRGSVQEVHEGGAETEEKKAAANQDQAQDSTNGVTSKREKEGATCPR